MLLLESAFRNSKWQPVTRKAELLVLVVVPRTRYSVIQWALVVAARTATNYGADSIAASHDFARRRMFGWRTVSQPAHRTGMST